MNEAQRTTFMSEIAGKTIDSAYWEADDGGYWVLTFTDGSEINVQLMVER